MESTINGYPGYTVPYFQPTVPEGTCDDSSLFPIYAVIFPFYFKIYRRMDALCKLVRGDLGMVS